MDPKEQEIFDKYERQTNHRKLLRMTESAAKFGWVEMAISFGVLALTDETAAGYILLIIAVCTLVGSLLLGVYADRVRKKIQNMVDTELGLG